MAEQLPRPHDVVLSAVLAGAAAALLLTVLSGPRVGGLALAAVLLIAAVLRLALPVRIVGALAVRSRAVDVLVLLVLAVSCAVLAWVVPTTA